MATPQPPQVSVAGQVPNEGQLRASPLSPQSCAPRPAPPWWQFWRWRPESVLAGATVVLAGATFLLAYMAWTQTAILATTDASTRRAAEAAVKSAGAAETVLSLTREQQRPIIWLTNDLGSPQYINFKNKPGGGQIAWAWHFTNYGRSPATHITFHQLIEIEGKTEEGYGYKGPSVGAPLPTSKDDFAEIASEPNIRQDRFNQLMTIDEAIGISGIINYRDVFGNEYTTSFCLRHLALGGIEYCSRGNDIR